MTCRDARELYGACVRLRAYDVLSATPSLFDFVSALLSTDTSCFPATFVSEVAKRGNLETLKRAHASYPSWVSNWACLFAARGGHLACMAYAHEHGCPLEPTIVVAPHKGVLDSAAAGRHLACLAYAHQHGSRGDASVATVHNGQLGCLKHKQEHHFARDTWMICNEATIFRKIGCANWPPITGTWTA
eukprot:gene317-577_t